MKKIILSLFITFAVSGVCAANTENYSEIPLPYGEAETYTVQENNESISNNEDADTTKVTETYTEVSETTSSTEIKKRKKFFDYVNIAPATMGPRQF